MFAFERFRGFADEVGLFLFFDGLTGASESSSTTKSSMSSTGC